MMDRQRDGRVDEMCECMKTCTTFHCVDTKPSQGKFFSPSAPATEPRMLADNMSRLLTRAGQECFMPTVYNPRLCRSCDRIL